MPLWAGCIQLGPGFLGSINQGCGKALTDEESSTPQEPLGSPTESLSSGPVIRMDLVQATCRLGMALYCFPVH